jgi:hypothetical protein
MCAKSWDFITLDLPRVMLSAARCADSDGMRQLPTAGLIEFVGFAGKAR